MIVLVTGANGFIGSAVMAALAEQGHVGVGFNLPNNVRNPHELADIGGPCDAVIHLAGVLGTHELFDTPQLAVDVNVTGTLNVLDWCREQGASYVGITMPPVFPSIYTATKIAATRLASAYHHTFGVPVSHVRAFNAFGPGQAHGPGHPQKIIPTFAYNAWRGIPLPVWGDGTQTVDLIHVADVSRMLVDALRFGDDDVFDAGCGIPVTVNGVVRMVAEIVGWDVSVEYLPMRRGERPTRIVADGEGWGKLGWHPEPRSLRDTVESYR
jgi:UDP-glucose 4-epimerase